MKLLLDTCTFFWIIEGSDKLSSRACELYKNPANEVYLSAVSAWEIVQKHALSKLPLPDRVDRFVSHYRVAHAVAELALDEPSVLQLARLPLLHEDPFDRMLVCQAIEHGLTLLTPDSLIRQYPVRIAW